MMKTKQKKKSVNKKVRTNRDQRSGDAWLRLIPFLVFLLIALFGFFSYKYYKELDFSNKARAFFDTQAKVAESVFVGLDKVIDGNGSSSVVNQVNADRRTFKRNLTERQAIDQARSQGAVGKLRSLDSDWDTLKNYADPILEGSTLISDVVKRLFESNREVTSMSKTIEVLTEGLNQSEGMAQEVSITNIEGRLISIDTELDKIAFSLSSLQSGISTYENVYEIVADSLVSVERNLSYLEREANMLGIENVFLVEDASGYITSLTEGVELLRAEVQEVSGLAEDYLALRTSIIGLSDYERQFSRQLQSLRSTYYDHDTKIFGINVNYPVLLLVIGVLLVLLIIALSILSRRQMTNLLGEMTRFRETAEERNKSEQEAILRLMDELADFSEGDLTVEAQVTEDSTGAIADSINFAIESMRDMVMTIIRTSKEIQSATKNIAGVSTLLENSSIEQSEEINLTHETAQRMSISLDNVAENSDSSAEIARTSVEIAKNGKAKVQETVGNMNIIRGNIQETSKHIKKLGESSQEIGDIIEIIKGITDQTNILSLNAAIQATFAGEAGRGFAVVADEIQRLSERSSNASKRIEVLIKTIQADSNEAISSMERSTKQVVSGANIAEKAGEELDKIEGVSTNLASLIINVSKATRDAANMAKEVSVMMDKLTEINERSRKEVKASVDSFGNIKTLSNELERSVTHFKL